jgi:uncharacterized protein (TIGR03085 family)
MVAKGGRLHRSTDRLQARTRQRPYTEIVASLRGGAPLKTPGVGEAVDLHEFFVHHEDVRRANGLEPRADPALDSALWRIVPVFGRFLSRQARGIEIELETPEGRVRRIRKGEQRVAAFGRPQELFLWLYSRPSEVSLAGDRSALARLDEVTLGM